MIVIGEKLNGTLPAVREAVERRDAAFVSNLARAQASAGAHYLDVNAGTRPDTEPDDLAWMVGVVEDTVDTPICLDSSNVATLSTVLPRMRRPGLVNSISGDPARLQTILPLASSGGAAVIALLMTERALPETVEERLAAARLIASRTRQAGITDDRVYFDPLVLSIATRPNAGVIFLETVSRLREEFPEAHVVSGLSNVSFGLPARRVLNRAFLALAAAAGMDAAIMDPLDPSLLAAASAARAVVGRDMRCREFLSLYRAGQIA